MPESSISWVCASRETRSTGSSSMQPLQRGRDLVLVAARLGLDGEGRRRLREGRPAGRRSGCALSASVSPVCVSLSLATAPMSPAWISGTWVWALPCSSRSEPTRSAESRVVLWTAESDLQRPGVDAEQADASGVRVDDGLEDEGRQRRVGGRLARRPPPPRRGRVPLGRAAVRGRGQQVHDRRRGAAWTPTLMSAETRAAPGRSFPATTAWRSPFTRSSWGSVPFSKNSSMSSSLLSATISTSFSRQASAASCCAAGTSVDLELAARVVAVQIGPSPRTRSTTPRKSFSSPTRDRDRHRRAAEGALRRTRGPARRRRSRGPCG